MERGRKIDNFPPPLHSQPVPIIQRSITNVLYTPPPAPIIRRPNRLIASVSTIQRFIISDLYVPSDLHREFGLPVIDWKGRWPYNTQEGIFIII